MIEQDSALSLYFVTHLPPPPLLGTLERSHMSKGIITVKYDKGGGWGRAFQEYTQKWYPIPLEESETGMLPLTFEERKEGGKK